MRERLGSGVLPSWAKASTPDAPEKGGHPGFRQEWGAFGFQVPKSVRKLALLSRGAEQSTGVFSSGILDAQLDDAV